MSFLWSSDEQIETQLLIEPVTSSTLSVIKQRRSTMNNDANKSPYRRNISTNDDDDDYLSIAPANIDVHMDYFSDNSSDSRSNVDYNRLANNTGIGDDDTTIIGGETIISSSKYEDFHTIDWQRDLARDRLRHKSIIRHRQTSMYGMLNGMWDAGSGWICVLLVGIAAGATAGIIDIGARWMSDLKDGICADRFWLDREHCCWSANDTTFKNDDCNAWTSWPEMLFVYPHNFAYHLLAFIFFCGWALLMAGFTVVFVKIFAPYACGSGIPEIKCILSGFVIRGYLGKWTFLIKAVGLILASASGLSLGKEGPMVHLACCIGNIFSYFFPKYGNNEAKKREILSASAAAGVSVAFGAPIGGVMFSLEEASYYFPLKTMWRSFFCALIASIILKIVNPFGSFQTSLFHVDYSIKWMFLELVPFALLGTFGGILGSIFIWANIKWCHYRKMSRVLGTHPITEVLIVTAITASISFLNPYTRQSASSLIKQLFDRCGPEDYMVDLCDYQNQTTAGGGEMGAGVHAAFWKLVLALLCKLVFTIFTFGIKVPSGLFVPSMAMGAIAGRLMGISMERLTRSLQADASYASSYWSCQIGTDCVMPGLYAMVGAAAVLGGVTRMTVSLVVIMFELTGSLEFIVPTMVAVMFAKWVGDAIYKRGIYDAHIDLNGYPFLDNKEEYHYSTVAINVMRPRTGDAPLRVITQESMTVGDIEQLLRETDYNGFPVVISDENHYLVGFVTRRDVHLALMKARKTQSSIVTNSIVYFSAHSPADTANDGTPAPLRLRRLIDLFPIFSKKYTIIIFKAPMTITDQTPMETVIDMFRKLGLRQMLVTRNGRLLGVITKKDILQYMKRVDELPDTSIVTPPPPPPTFP